MGINFFVAHPGCLLNIAFAVDGSADQGTFSIEFSSKDSDSRVNAKHAIASPDGSVSVLHDVYGPTLTIGESARDRDGLPDEWEDLHELNPDDKTDAVLDKDGDGVSNLEEYQLGTDASNPLSSIPMSALPSWGVGGRR